jgi:hypothetical protein
LVVKIDCLSLKILTKRALWLEEFMVRRDNPARKVESASLSFTAARTPLPSTRHRDDAEDAHQFTSNAAMN